MKHYTYLFIFILILLCKNNIYAQENVGQDERIFQFNLQGHLNISELMYGKNSSLVQNLPLSTFTFEGTGFDKIGSTYFFIDLEVGNANFTKNKMLGGVYTEFSREWCFWKNTKAENLTIHTEFDAGVGYGSNSWGYKSEANFDFRTALLAGLSYAWGDENWFVQLQALSRYELKDSHQCGGEGWQFTVAYSYTPIHWFTLSGYADFWQIPLDKSGKLNDIKSFHISIEPYLWFNVTRYLSVGTRLRFTYNNYQGILSNGDFNYDQKVYFAPTIGLKWNLN